MNRLDQLHAAAANFHAKHPAVWVLFERFTFERIDRGFRHYSVAGIWERIRWETDQAPKTRADFKLNNNHRAFYARRFHSIYPRHGDFFRLRVQSSAQAPPATGNQLRPRDF